MKIVLKQSFRANGDVDPFDVKQMKKALNRLGYYQPHETVGITGIPDTHVFAALKAFQKNHDLKVTGNAKPGDETIDALNREVAKTPEGQYIWRTVEDDRVRSNHAGYNRTVRDWADSPDPGEEFNCRCWTEPLQKAEGLHQVVISSINDATPKWTEDSFKNWLKFGGGKEVHLDQIGYLKNTIDKAREVMFKKLEDQITNLIRKKGEGDFEYSTIRPYDFSSVCKFFGKGIIRTSTHGNVQKNGNSLIVKAIIDYEYDDVFTDVKSVRQKLPKKTILNDPVAIENMPEGWIKSTDALGDIYPILGWWQTELTGSVLGDKSK